MATIKKGLRKPQEKKASPKKTSLADTMKKARELGVKLVKEKRLKPL